MFSRKTQSFSAIRQHIRGIQHKTVVVKIFYRGLNGHLDDAVGVCAIKAEVLVVASDDFDNLVTHIFYCRGIFKSRGSLDERHLVGVGIAPIPFINEVWTFFVEIFILPVFFDFFYIGEAIPEHNASTDKETHTIIQPAQNAPQGSNVWDGNHIRHPAILLSTIKFKPELIGARSNACAITFEMDNTI